MSRNRSSKKSETKATETKVTEETSSSPGTTGVLPKRNVVAEAIALATTIESAKNGLLKLQLSYYTDFTGRDPKDVVDLVHVVTQNQVLNVHSFVSDILQKNKSFARAIANACVEMVRRQTAIEGHALALRACIPYLNPEDHEVLRSFFYHVGSKLTKEAFDLLVQDCIEAKVSKTYFPDTDQIAKNCTGETLKAAYTYGVINSKVVAEVFNNYRKTPHEKVIFLTWFKKIDGSLEHVDLSQIYNVKPEYSETEELFKVLKDVKNVRGVDALKSAYVDQILKSGDIRSLSNFVRTFPGFRTDEIRATIVKALSGPPVEELVDQIMNGSPDDWGHRGMPFHPFFGPMPFGPMFLGRGRY